MPGTGTIPCASASSINAGKVPGAKTTETPAAAARRTSSRVRIVPTPTATPSATSARVARWTSAVLVASSTMVAPAATQRRADASATRHEESRTTGMARCRAMRSGTRKCAVSGRPSFVPPAAASAVVVPIIPAATTPPRPTASRPRRSIPLLCRFVHAHKPAADRTRPETRPPPWLGRRFAGPGSSGGAGNRTRVRDRSETASTSVARGSISPQSALRAGVPGARRMRSPPSARHSAGGQARCCTSATPTGRGDGDARHLIRSGGEGDVGVRLRSSMCRVL